MSKEFTYQDVAEHNTKKDIYVVIHDKVYDTTKFIDEHPCVLTASFSMFGPLSSNVHADMIQ